MPVKSDFLTGCTTHRSNGKLSHCPAPLKSIVGTVRNNGVQHLQTHQISRSAAAVRDLFSQIQKEWDAQLAGQDISNDNWYRIEIEKILAVFSHAARLLETVSFAAAR